ncbi:MULTISPECIES: peptidoglycan DD-metalloendopeptidase family protein [Pseudomonas]|uniref:Peptidoglycan DD-metalloendopeptidase family protein n=1 Tax=Pseudomonas sessilinigenes TaxID=658629 RepID=A0ABX8MYT5_9PSED|nr:MULTISPECIES: peptidoglycan DD-metalloendopeptidase family protein [Pseudomonas]AZC24695.1 Lipoprotein NlpD [Pseudomonas sessilinigenes]QXH43618.1 peptidoglycan DD-metalloendopeptidase family protein [Pseudomonas sessilinigenes]UMZ14911.1 peptidoglycan DD-metalloendopeptidase family protein [Pseudomonas sp. MPFS]
MFARFVFIALLLTLSACSSKPSNSGPLKAGEYRVQRGDTLYSIASRNGTNWKEVARLNGLKAPYTVEVGQVLKVGGGAPRTTRVASSKTRTSTSRSKAPPPAPPMPKVTLKGWTWPLRGVLIGRFSPTGKLNQGIRIATAEGQPIHASLGGKVAFAGYMRGYGNLMILQHGPSYTSTYAYNSKLLVKEGQMVIKGQKIAEAGSQDTDRAQLYFEIRANGVPVDPIRLLPPG